MTEFIPPGTRYVDLPSPFPMKRGGVLQGARLAYETWGTLDAARGNAILILPGLSPDAHAAANADRSEEHTSELQSLMRISYAVFCLKKKKNTNDENT